MVLEKNSDDLMTIVMEFRTQRIGNKNTARVG